MAQSILFPQTDPTGSPLDRIKDVRRRLSLTNPQLAQELEGRFPVLTAPEGEVVPPADPGIGGAAAGKDAVGSITEMLTNLGTQSGMKPKDIQEVARGLDGVQPAEPYGPQIFDQGGILGTGMTPIDVLAFVIGAGITSNLPQDQAIARTLQIASLPSQFRANQRQAANEFVQRKLDEARLKHEERRIAIAEQDLAEKSGTIAKREQLINQIGDKPVLSTADKLRLRAVGIDVPFSSEPTQIIHNEEGAFIVSKQLDPNTGQPLPAQQIPGIAGKSPRSSTDLSQRTREQLAAAKEAGEDISIQEASRRAFKQEMQLAEGKGFAGAAGREAGERSQLLDPQERVEWRHPGSLQPAPQGTTRAQAIDQGYVKVDKAFTQKFAAMASAETQVDAIVKFTEGLIKEKNPYLAFFVQGPKLKVNLQAGRTYDQLRKAFAGQLAKAFGGEAGVLTNQDIERVTEGLPGFTDHAGSRDLKNAYLRAIVASSKEGMRAAITGDETRLVQIRERLGQMINNLTGLTKEAEHQARQKQTPQTVKPTIQGVEKVSEY